MTTITERPLLHSIRVETFNIGTPAALILDHSRLDVATLGTGGESADDQWTDWTPNVVQISTERGGRQEGLAIENSTGVLTVNLRGVTLGYPTPTFLRGQPIRLQHVNSFGTPTVIYTGRVLDVTMTNSLDGRGNVIPVIQLIAVDNYVNHDETTRYGAMPPDGSETFTQRIARLTTTATAPIEPPVLNRTPTFSPWTEQRRNRVPDPTPTRADGWKPSGSVTTDFSGGYLEASASSSQGGSVVQTYDFGVPLPAGGSVPISADIRTPFASTCALAIYLYNAAGQAVGLGAIQNFVGTGDWQTISVTATSTLTEDTHACVAVLLIPAGATVGIRHLTTAPGTYFDGDTNPSGELERTRWLGTPNASASVAETRTFTGWDALPDTDPILGRTVYESSLANHFTLACNSAGAMWWIGADNVTRFAKREYDPYTAVTFIGLRTSEPVTNALHYIRPVSSAGSQAFFNRVRMHNHGATIDPDTGDWVADDHDLLTTNLGSVYGFRDAELETNYADEPTGDPDRWMLPAQNFTPKATAIIWNAQEDLDRIPDLEIGRSVWLPTDDITRDPWPWNVIIGIRHTITPTRWMVELTLIGVSPS